MRWYVHVSALVVGLILTAVVHAFAGDEIALCEEGIRARCPIGSGGSWFWTGVVLIAPVLVTAGLAWTIHLRDVNQLGPFAPAVIPDWEELLEGMAVIIAFLLTFLIIRGGPKTAMLDSSWPNSWLEGRLGEVRGEPLVPSRRSWFLIGLLVSLPFSFSLGTAVGREWFAFRRNRADRTVVGDERTDQPPY